MLQRNQEYSYGEEEMDTPLEGHKSCRSEAYADDIYERSDNSRDDVRLSVKTLI